MTDKDNKVDKKNLNDDKTNVTSGDDKSVDKSTEKKLSAADATKIAAQAKLSSSSSQSSTKSQAKAPVTEKASAPSKTRAYKQPSKAPAEEKVKHPTSKLAILALFIALIVGAGIVALYWWQQQQIDGLQEQLHSKQRESFEQLESQLSTQLSQKLQATHSNTVQGLTTFADDIKKESRDKIAELEDSIQVLADQQPNNWQLTEAEYLVRMAGRVLWLEKDVTTTISLMHDADARLNTLKDPRLLPIRQMIHQDIEQLKLLPQLETEEVILSLMGLAKQVPNLPLNQIQLPDSTEQFVDNKLSEDINDWRDNLAKSWTSFKEHFITIRRRTGSVEPLMHPEFQQNLYHNLELKIQQVQWAASQGKQSLYQTSIDDIQQWLTTYFDMENESTQLFSQRLTELHAKTIIVNYPQSLTSHQALRTTLSRNRVSPPPVSTIPEEEVIEPTESETSTIEPEGNL